MAKEKKPSDMRGFFLDKILCNLMDFWMSMPSIVVHLRCLRLLHMLKFFELAWYGVTVGFISVRKGDFIMRAFGGLILVALIAGCANSAELAAEQQREVEHMVQIYGPACDKLGYASESDAWRNCLLQLDARDTRNNRVHNMDCRGSVGFVQCTNF